MKKTFFTIAICCVSTVLMAENLVNNSFAVDSIKPKADTTHFYLGRHELLVTNGGNDVHFIRNRYLDYEYSSNNDKKNPFNNFDSHWASFNFGIGGFGEKMFSTAVGSESDYIDVNPLRSFSFHWNISDIALPLTSSNNIGIVSGVGVSWDYYALSNKSLCLRKADSILIHYNDTIEYKRNKLRTCNLVVPLMLEFHPAQNSNLYLIVGVEGNIRLGAKTKQVTNSGRKSKHKSDFYMNPLTCNFVVRAGYENFGVYFSTACTPMFKDGKGPDVHPFSAGISLNL